MIRAMHYDEAARLAGRGDVTRRDVIWSRVNNPAAVKNMIIMIGYIISINLSLPNNFHAFVTSTLIIASIKINHVDGHDGSSL